MHPNLDFNQLKTGLIEFGETITNPFVLTAVGSFFIGLIIHHLINYLQNKKTIHYGLISGLPAPGTRIQNPSFNRHNSQFRIRNRKKIFACRKILFFFLGNYYNQRYQSSNYRYQSSYYSPRKSSSLQESQKYLKLKKLNEKISISELKKLSEMKKKSFFNEQKNRQKFFQKIEEEEEEEEKKEKEKNIQELPNEILEKIIQYFSKVCFLFLEFCFLLVFRK